MDALFERAGDDIEFKVDSGTEVQRAVGFASVAGFPHVQGIIDCTHVTIKAPTDQAGRFLNQKGYHSLNIQLVCDHIKSFMEVCACYPGSCNDPFILLQSQVPLLFMEPSEIQTWMLPGKASLVRRWLMTPVCYLATEAERHYNRGQLSATVNIELAIGLLKMRSRCLDLSGGTLQYTPSRVTLIVAVCGALHNMILQRGVDLEEGEVLEWHSSSEEEEDQEEEEEDEDEEEADKELENGPHALQGCCDGWFRRQGH
ncbi:putative nuclease HARBI1 [Heterodontus francisci]|uniref:putative nuclease HARBI1 n=1 Tax=Heterodontus francisci TaxID=7792 RepID=UPI00355B8847